MGGGGQGLGSEAWFLKARTALSAAAVTPRDRATLIRVADRLAAKIDCEEMAWGQPLAATIQAGVAAFRGDAARGPVLLAAALASFEKADMALYAAGALRLPWPVTPRHEDRQVGAQDHGWMRRKQK